MLALIIVGLALSVVYLRVAPAQYTARSSVYLSVSGATDAASLAAGSVASQAQARNFALIATRELVLQPVVDQLGLNEPASQLSRSVTATVPVQTSMILVESTARSPQSAANVANALADSLTQTAGTLLPPAKKNATAITLQVVERAAVPTSPSSPNPRVIVPLGLGLGLIVGVLAALALQGRRSRRAQAAAEAAA